MRCDVAKRSQMAKIYARGSKLYVTYYLGKKRIQKSTGLEDTPENRKHIKAKVLPELEYRLSIGDLSKKESKTFSEYYLRWLPEKQNNRNYKSLSSVYRRVNEFFGNMNIDSITRQMVKEYIRDLDMKNYSKQPFLSCISGVLETALDDEAVDKNVAVGIKIGTSERKKVNPFSPDEVEMLLTHAEGKLKNYLGIALNTGMRPSEILGLMRQDIKDGHIHIQRSVTKDGVGQCKNKASRRIIPILEVVKPYLYDQMEKSKGFYLFEFKGHRLWDAGYFRRPFYELQARLGIPRRSLYDTRHTFATAMLNSGQFRVLDIAAILGHTNANMIMTVYGGFIKGNHLKIDTDFNPFLCQNGDSIVESAVK
jgi:integrase